MIQVWPVHSPTTFKTSTMRHECAARFAYERRVGDAFTVANVLRGRDGVVGVFLNGVIHRRIDVALRPVVIDAKSASDIEGSEVFASSLIKPT